MIHGNVLKNWNEEPYITYTQLMEMPAYERAWFYNQPNIWRSLDIGLHVLHNCAHPSNRKLFLEDLIREARV